MSADDRAEFAAEQLVQARHMADDPRVRALDVELFTESDKYGFSYFWTWLGLPIIQSPIDVLVLQEVIWQTKPDLIIETGVARGGSIVFFASMLQLLGAGEVVGIDIDIRAHNRAAIEDHPFANRVRLLEGSSVDGEIVAEVAAMAQQRERVMVVLDSNHTHEHVLQELHAYAPMVTPGCYLVVADTIVESIPPQLHRPRPWGPGDSPATAVAEFLAANSEFAVDEDVDAKLLLTSNRGGYLRRVR